MGLRQEKFARQLQRDLSELFLANKSKWLAGKFVTISAVKVSPDLGHAKVYLSLFNANEKAKTLELIEENSREIRMELARVLRNQVRKVPELAFYEDDTLAYVSKMDAIFDQLAKDKISDQNPDSES